MTPQEQQLLVQLTQRINQTQLQEKDPDAENLLGRELGANPDALYILAQTVLVQDIALQHAKSQVAELQEQLAQAEHPQPAKATSFLGRLLGEHEPQPAQPQYQQSAPQYQQAQPPYQPVPQYAPPAPQYAAPQYIPAAAPMGMPMGTPVVMGGQPSFLRGAMQTAAGVAAGALAFEGVESLVHGVAGGFGGGYGGFGGGFGGFGGGFGNERPTEEVVNNYYGDSGEREYHDTNAGDFSSGSYDDRGDSHLSDASYADSSLNDDSAAYDNSVDNVSLDDSSGYDDGSSQI